MRHSRATPCYKAFIAGQQARARSPLPFGEYKLREAKHIIQRYMESMNAIQDYLLNPKKFYPGASLGYCTTEDKATYLKGIPESIARVFGKDVLPSIKALGPDGLGEDEIKIELKIAATRTQDFLDECEIQRQRLRLGINTEYRSIKRGYSELFALLQDAESIIKSPLDALDRAKTIAARS